MKECSVCKGHEHAVIRKGLDDVEGGWGREVRGSYSVSLGPGRECPFRRVLVKASNDERGGRTGANGRQHGSGGFRARPRRGKACVLGEPQRCGVRDQVLSA